MSIGIQTGFDSRNVHYNDPRWIGGASSRYLWVIRKGRIGSCNEPRKGTRVSSTLKTEYFIVRNRFGTGVPQRRKSMVGFESLRIDCAIVAPPPPGG